MPKNVIVGTAGHIDHGKTALVQALTGVNADRWAEEQRRGITIDLGFAHLDLSQDLRLGFIDVPGHERFVKNMLAGAGGVDLALLIVAADESVMPQTREHFEILRLLGIPRGIVVVTKTDLVDADLIDLVRLEVDELVAGSFLAEAPVVAVSAKTGAGLDELRSTLDDEARAVEAKNRKGRFRLPIDRVFSSKGFGAVVTGTLTSGAVELEDEVEVQPGGLRARVRGVQAHAESRKKANAGERTALNLSGVEMRRLARGMQLCEPGVLQPTDSINLRFELIASAKPLKHAAPVRVHIGSAEIEGRLYWLERQGGTRPKSLSGGARTFAQIRLEEPALTVRGDRLIVRRSSPVTTIGGGVVLEPNAPSREPYKPLMERLRALEGEDDAVLASTLAQQRPFGLPAQEVVSITGWSSGAVREAARAAGLTAISERPWIWMHAERLAEAEARMLDDLEAFHRLRPLEPGKPRAELGALYPGADETVWAALLGRLVSDGRLVLEGELVRLASHQITLNEEEAEARDSMLKAFDAAGLEVPRVKEFLPGLAVDSKRALRLLTNLLRDGELVRISDEMVFHRSALAELDRRLAEFKRTSPRITVSEFKDLAGVSRKYAIPLLEYLDRAKKTRRQGDARLLL